MSFSADDINQVEAARKATEKFARLLTELLGDVPGTEFHDIGKISGASVRMDLAEMDWLSSVALNELISMNRHAKSRGLRFILENANDTIRGVFTLTRLERMFEFTPTAGIQQES